MRASRPTDARVVAAVRFGGSFRKVCRDGIYPARGLTATQGPRDDASIVPYRGLRCGGSAVSRLAAAFAVVRRGGFHIRPQAFAPPQGSRADMESAPTGAAIPQPAVFPPFGPGVCAAARSFQNSVFLRRPRLSGRFCFARVCAAGGRHIVGQGVRGTMCARCPKTGRFAARAANLPACPAVAR